MDIKNRQHNIQKILLRAWRERWSEFQFGIKIKQALPMRLPADYHHLTDVLMEQCLIGSGVNRLLLAYLKHSLHSHLISFPAVIKRITKYSHYERYHCITALLEFLISISDSISCRTKPEESSLMNAVLSLVHWLIELSEKMFLKLMEQSNNQATQDQKQCLEKIKILTHKIVQNEYLMGVIYLAKLEDQELYEKCMINYKRIHSLSKENVVKDFYQMVFIKFDSMPMKEFEPRIVEPISFCIQPFLSIDVLVNASAEPSIHVSKLLMIQKLKKYSNARLYCEIIRSCFITLCHVKDMDYKIWGAFTLYKIPQILKQIHMQSKNFDDKQDFSDDVVKAFEMLLECTPILDLLDTSFQCSSIETILVELKKLNLVNDEVVRKIADKRQQAIAKLEKFHIPLTQPPLDKFVAAMDTPLSGLIGSLKSDPVKPEFVNVLTSLVIDNRAYLLYSAASIKGKHRTMINGLMKFNDICKEVTGEQAKSKLFNIKSNIFDTTFIMLFSIMQKVGIDKFPEVGGDFFFEKWLRDGLIDLSKPKSPLSIVKMSDQSKVDELISYFNDNSLTMQQQPPPIAFKFSEICWTIPSMLYNVIIAWENDTIKPQAVKNILDNMRSKNCCFAVVAAAWLCSYMRILRDDEMKKPQFMIQILTKPLDENIMKQETFSERFSLTHEIILKFLEDQSALDIKKPMNNVFNEKWKEVMAKRWLPYEIAVSFEDILKACGPFWLMKNLVDQIIQAKFIKDMENTLDIAFSVMHLNIEACTEALLKDIIIVMMFNKNQMSKITDSQSRVLAKLCIYAILATLESIEHSPQKKRPRADDDDESSPMAKMRKTGIDSAVEGSPTEKESSAQQLKEPLKNSLQELFKVFHQQVANDEMSLKVNFIFQFFSLLVQFEKSIKIKSVLKLIPNGLITNMLKIIPHEDLTYGLVLRLYDLSVSSGRSSAIGDLCLLKHIQTKRTKL